MSYSQRTFYHINRDTRILNRSGVSERNASETRKMISASVPDVETERISFHTAPISTDFHLSTPQFLHSMISKSENAML